MHVQLCVCVSVLRGCHGAIVIVVQRQWPKDEYAATFRIIQKEIVAISWDSFICLCFAFWPLSTTSGPHDISQFFLFFFCCIHSDAIDLCISGYSDTCVCILCYAFPYKTVPQSVVE